MNMDLLFGRRVLRNGLVLATSVLTCTTLQANDHEGKDQQSSTSGVRGQEHHSYQAGAMSADKFIQKAAAGGQMEVQMGQLGQQQAQNSEVKQLAAALVKDHTDANQRLQQLASSKNITLNKTDTGVEPEHGKHQQELQKLRGKSGAEFDKEFVRMAIKDHKKDISEFERAQKQINDPELKSFITQTLPKLRQHLQMAQTAARAVGVDAASIASEGSYDNDSASGSAAGAISGSRQEDQLDRPRSSLDGATEHDASGTINHNNPSLDAKGSIGDHEVGVNADVDTDDHKAEVDVDADKDHKVFEKGDGKVLGLPTSKTDGKFLGIIPNPRADKEDKDAEIKADVDTDNDDDSVGGSATVDVDTGSSKKD